MASNIATAKCIVLGAGKKLGTLQAEASGKMINEQ
jgi:hypothetical protein